MWVKVRFEFCWIFFWTFCRILWLQIVFWAERDSSAQWVQADRSLISLISRDHVLCVCTVGIVLSSRDPKQRQAKCYLKSITGAPTNYNRWQVNGHNERITAGRDWLVSLLSLKKYKTFIFSDFFKTILDLTDFHCIHKIKTLCSNILCHRKKASHTSLELNKGN